MRILLNNYLFGNLILFIFCLITSTAVNAQESFYRIFNNGEIDFEFVQELTEEENSIILYSYARSEPGQDGGSLVKRMINPQDGGYSVKKLNTPQSNLDKEMRNGVKFHGVNYVAGLINRGGPILLNYDIAVYALQSDSIIMEYVYGIDGKFESGYGIAMDSGHDLVVCGPMDSEIWSNTHASIVIKLDTLGNEIWTRRVEGAGADFAARSVAVDRADNIYILVDESALSPSIQQVAMTKLSSDGDSLWTRYYPGSASLAQDLHLNARGNLIASVTADYDGEGRSFTFMELDTAGNRLWSRSYREEMDGGAFAQNFITLKDGKGYAIALNMGHLALLVTDLDGNPTNIQHYRDFPHRFISDILELSDGSFAMTGEIYDDVNDIPETMWLLKTDVEGRLVSASIEQDYPDVEIYPNPTADVIQIRNVQYDQLLVVSSDGSIYSRLDEVAEVDLTDAPSGLYYLTFLIADEVYVHKVIKE